MINRDSPDVEKKSPRGDEFIHMDGKVELLSEGATLGFRVLHDLQCKSALNDEMLIYSMRCSYTLCQALGEVEKFGLAPGGRLRNSIFFVFSTHCCSKQTLCGLL